MSRTAHLAGLLIASLLIAVSSVADQNAAQSPAKFVIQATIPRSGYSMAFGFGSLWMMSNGRLARANAVDNSIVDIDIPAGEVRRRAPNEAR